MSEEEKKSFEELKKEINKPLEVPEDKCNTFILYNIDNAKVIVNLIEKQQEKIEELKEKNRELLKERAGYAEEYIHNNPWLYKQLDELYIFRGEVDRKYISKDKIREKIKSLEEKIHIVIPNEYNKVEIMNEFKNEGAVDILKELLEEE